ncbi:hypothetical protein HanRHA438_Chr03g0123541 [Helianthus annuus]|nr:hypothetical protein HanRHA438_Chr03g0123541 [Helianthus annuus]
MAVRNQTELEKVIKEHSTFLSKFEAFTEKAEKSFMDIKQILDKLANNQSKSDGGTSTSQLEINSNTRTNRLYRLGKIEFPKFNGSEVEDWVCRCEHFFDVDDTPENFKVRFAPINLEGKTMKWHVAYLKTLVKPISEVTWSEYSRNIIDRFSTNLFHDAMGLLTSTVQVGSLEDYCKKFDENLLRVTICEKYAVSIFLNVLKPELGCPVRMFGPKKLKEAYEIAKNQVNLLAIFDSCKGFKKVVGQSVNIHFGLGNSETKVVLGEQIPSGFENKPQEISNSEVSETLPLLLHQNENILVLNSISSVDQMTGLDDEESYLTSTLIPIHKTVDKTKPVSLVSSYILLNVNGPDKERLMRLSVKLKQLDDGKHNDRQLGACGIDAINQFRLTKMLLDEIGRDIHIEDQGWKVMLLRYFNFVKVHENGKLDKLLLKKKKECAKRWLIKWKWKNDIKNFKELQELQLQKHQIRLQSMEIIEKMLWGQIMATVEHGLVKRVTLQQKIFIFFEQNMKLNRSLGVKHSLLFLTPLINGLSYYFVLLRSKVL